jgi:hypothetical protein
MPAIGFDHNFIRGLSDFWQRFFADSDQLVSMYDGAAVLMGQAYLDILANTLGVSLVDAPVFCKEYYKLITIREDQVSFVPGTSGILDRWNFSLSSGVVSFASLDNKVIEPTASLQELLDYDLGDGVVQFRRDPTDPDGLGVPMQGYARRQVDISAIAQLVDGYTVDFVSRGICKGDVLRLLEVGPGGSPRPQRRLLDLPIVVVRPDAVYLGGTTAPVAGAANYVVLRQPATPSVTLEAFSFTASTAQLQNVRIVEGTVQVFAKRNSDGADVVEDVDYTVDYELGRIIQLTPWQVDSANKVNYQWLQEVFPYAGVVAGSPPYFFTGVISGTTTVRVTQLAFWAPDALVDRFILSNNFGSLINRTGPSSEDYRAFLLGIFQLYILGPVLSRIESAMNVILGLPVIRDDGEVLLDVVMTGPDTNIVRTTRFGGTVVEYDFPKATPLRTDVLTSTNWGTLTFASFEPLTTVVQVTDYIQDPSWWYNITIPQALFSSSGGATVPDAARRLASPAHVHHVINAEDRPCIGDPGLYIGADERGVIPPPGKPVLRRRFAFVMMDRFFKAHMFFVGFDSSIFTANAQTAKYSRIIDDLNDLIRAAKPAHTYIYIEPATSFLDTMIMADAGYYQSQNYAGADPDALEIYTDISQLPSTDAPYFQLGLTCTPTVESTDQFLFADHAPLIGATSLRIGDSFRFEEFTESISFPDLITPVALPDASALPARSVLVSVFVNARVAGNRVVESVDYAVDYVGRTVQALTPWDGGGAGVSVQFVQARLINIIDAAPSPADGDITLSIDGVDPTIVRANYDPTAVDLFDNPWPVMNHRDMSFVERPLTVKVIS